MKKYSQANVLTYELSQMSGGGDWLSRLLYKLNKTSSVILTIEIPLNLYLRAEVFCDDIEELSEVIFTQKDLIELLFNDFLLFVKKNQDPTDLFRLLTSLDLAAGKERGLQQENATTFKTMYKETTQKMQTIKVSLKRKSALRGEVFLADLEEVYPNHGYSLERVLEMLYCDFIDKFRKGNHSDAVNNILKVLENEE
jgi:hypothetical protein